jgi:hypothetical protein
MRSQLYTEFTIRHYLSALAHFNHWALSRPLAVADIGETAIREFIGLHLPICACPKPCFRGRLEIAAALRRLLKLLQQLVEAKSSVSKSYRKIFAQWAPEDMQSPVVRPPCGSF